jgi:hypothetical protein
VVVAPEPIQERDYCLGCGHNVKHDAMAWDGHRYVCNSCANKEAV